MKDTLELKNPIMIDNKQVAAVTYDADEIDGILFATAEARRKEAAGMRNASISPAAEFDFGLHLYLVCLCVFAFMPLRKIGRMIM